MPKKEKNDQAAIDRRLEKKGIQPTQVLTHRNYLTEVLVEGGEKRLKRFISDIKPRDSQ